MYVCTSIESLTSVEGLTSQIKNWFLQILRKGMKEIIDTDRGLCSRGVVKEVKVSFYCFTVKKVWALDLWPYGLSRWPLEKWTLDL